MKPLIVAVGFVVLVSGAAFAPSPYAGMQMRSVKALSNEQIADLKAGRGMGLALPAELNGYPGPSHLLKLSDRLELSADQKTRIKQLFDSMKAEAVPLGAKLLAQETALDQQFADQMQRYSMLRGYRFRGANALSHAIEPATRCGLSLPPLDA